VGIAHPLVADNMLAHCLSMGLFFATLLTGPCLAHRFGISSLGGGIDIPPTNQGPETGPLEFFNISVSLVLGPATATCVTKSCVSPAVHHSDS